ncbi:Pre-mRNA-splicing factor cwf19 [Friedmanniomyces endolithicus]|uniref:Pre-mRNA-splicing factor cwf19 n=1 Tax=Friedmanniomyces endolithicus TaxID=329885 RepID=A0AAN6KAL4_9PEZI|nr:Pre-mRNA-splicing factor cwf19 [Friedmanniomyces endolithicus]KAK0969165.1 Pre-mRNA-splicing factor cwf19 [Friedmanniomyces endolithicus]KAK0972657.1 Pre-mRNA-splicing factor cwf19 [Friedmanniomyces endolithicus]KAK1029922.1 Pre-mRNA-splicing factor cwf19 [Friedmanniomyces endolithicus]
MGLEDFEKELAGAREEEPRKQRGHGDRDEGGERTHRHHHRSHRQREEAHDDDRRRRHKRHRDRGDEGERSEKKRRRSESVEITEKKAVEEQVKVFDSDGDDDGWVEKEAMTAPPEEQLLDERDEKLKESDKVQRDAWMREPSALDINYTQSRKAKEPASQFVGAKNSHEFKVHEADVKSLLKDLENDFDDEDGDGADVAEKVQDEPTQHEVSYTFGDSGSSWRMMKLKAVYRQAEESKQSVEDVALKRYGDLRDFDDAREEERELDRRKMYGKDYVGLVKPSGEFFQERKMKAGLARESQHEDSTNATHDELPQGEMIRERPAAPTTAPLDLAALNKLQAQVMRAKLRNAPNATQLEQEYNLAASASLANNAKPDVVVLNTMENRHLAGGRTGEVTAVTNKRGLEHGIVTENEHMTISDMVRQEKRTRNTAGGESRAFADRIAKDGKFKADLDYLDDNATNLSKHVPKSEVNLRNTAIEDYQRLQSALSSCPLCHHDPNPPLAPLVSLATLTYLTLPPLPELTPHTALIVPLEHHRNLLECSDTEWEEIRNFMKSLTRYYDSLDQGVVFYENAAHMLSQRKPQHAAMVAVPLPRHLAELAPRYFQEAVLGADAEWSQHRPLIDTLALSRKPGGGGRWAFRRSMVSEMPYFHVWFGVDGGLGHVVEDGGRWPKGDRFAREVLGGMLGVGGEIVRREGRWEKGVDCKRRVEGFRRGWGEFDWTKALLEEG